MERSVAIKRLGKLLGKNLGYRVPKAPDQESREAAVAQWRIAREAKKSLEEMMNQRRRAILAADADYQGLKAAYEREQKLCEKLSGTANHYRITVGTSNSMFFTVRAQGDSWEQVIDKLTEKETLR